MLVNSIIIKLIINLVLW